MGNAVKLQPADDNADNSILENFGVDISNLKPGCVVVLIDINGPVAFQANGAGLQGEDSVELEATALLCTAFVERTSEDDDFCRELSEWAAENVDVSALGLSLGDTLTEDEEPDAITADTVNEEWLSAEADTPYVPKSKKLLH